MLKETKFYCEVDGDMDIGLVVFHLEDAEENEVVVNLELGNKGGDGQSALTLDEFKDFCKVVAAAKKALADG